MLIRIDTDQKVIAMPSMLKQAIDKTNKMNKLLGKDPVTLYDMLPLEGYSYSTQLPTGKSNGDKLNKKTFEKLMENLKETDKAVYEEYLDLKDRKKVCKDGKMRPTSFLTLKQWYYKKFPDQDPKNGNTKKKK